MAYIIALELRGMGLPVELLALFDTQLYGYSRKLPFMRTAWLQITGFLKMSFAEKMERLKRVFGRARARVKRKIENSIPTSWLSQAQQYERIIRLEGMKDGAAIR